MRRCFKRIVGVFLFSICRLYFFILCRKNKDISAERASNVLSQNGYSFHNPMPDCPPLKTTEIELSIIVPIYNVENYLRKCIESICHSSFEESREIICINDGSTDSSLQILESLKKEFPNIIVISQSNKGLSAARNAGIEVARGKYISFIDSDDWVSEDYFQRMYEEIVHTGADIVQSNYYVVDEKSDWKGIGGKQINVVFDVSDIAKYADVLHGFAWGSIFKKSLFGNVRFPFGFRFEDCIVQLLLMPLSNKISVLAAPMYYYLIRSTGLCQSKVQNQIVNVDQCYLQIAMIDHIMENKGFQFSNWSYGVFLREESIRLEQRCSRIASNNVHCAMFELVSSYIRKWNYEFKSDNHFLSMIDKSFIFGNYWLWKHSIMAKLWMEQ